ncbi:MAG: 4Fe-4S ferredoxin [Bacteroidetes bacterium GWF2_42_66]|nr:MAG: 4Fe-4S ferredoxin [Bacteroidetes bacterium GWA2_42_15]OFY01680.1 MAG: 4Fe-4S ferredoxin [Bacteroidetes bacterium GWE2_42_39]OFY41010.1 MAG: 4Fe-4S ferredoxin [Bacteroidetes bacterium GWF2_42_66]HBL76622.1 4Fe-4S ferredoxin [Prolixibacteraceae bacterium]HCU61001.1 4Fe-4S ferredoxin [Prolixibacteraceae bacterium]
MGTVKIEPAYCPQNHYCPVISVCPAGAIIQKSPFTAPEIDRVKCTNCGRCTRFCAFGAFQMS